MFLHNIECKSVKYFRNSYCTPQRNAPEFIFQLQCDAWTRNNYSLIFSHHIGLIPNAILKSKVYYSCPACSWSIWLNFHHHSCPLMSQTEVHIWVICPLGSVGALNASIHAFSEWMIDNRVYFGLVPNGRLSPSGLPPFILHIFVTTSYNAALTIRSLLWSSPQCRLCRLVFRGCTAMSFLAQKK